MARYTVTVDGREYDITVEYRSEHYRMTVNGREIEVYREDLQRGRSLLLIDSTSHEVDIRYNGGDNERIVFMQGTDIPLQIEDYNLAQLRKTAGMAAGGAKETMIAAPMPGLVVDVRVAVGDAVKKNQPLAVIEAMKMENILKARTDGTVKAIHANKGQSVDKGDKLIELE